MTIPDQYFFKSRRVQISVCLLVFGLAGTGILGNLGKNKCVITSFIYPFIFEVKVILAENQQ